MHCTYLVAGSETRAMAAFHPLASSWRSEEAMVRCFLNVGYCRSLQQQQQKLEGWSDRQRLALMSFKDEVQSRKQSARRHVQQDSRQGETLLRHCGA
jgi:hypothetical protein